MSAKVCPFSVEHPSSALPDELLASAARHCGYRVKGLAGELGCSCRWLEILCQRQFAQTPHAWLAQLREREIEAMARAGLPAKVISETVGFADTASFCHSLKRSAGCTLRHLRALTGNRDSQKDNKPGSPRCHHTP